MDYLARDRFFINRLSYRLNLTKKKDDLWNTRCPICGDSKTSKTKKRFFIYIKEGRATTVCHNCEWFGSIEDFIKQQFPDLLDEYKFWGFSPKKQSLANETLKALEAMPIEEIKESKPLFISKGEFFSLTADIALLSNEHPAKKYTIHRQIPFNLVRYHKNFYQLTTEIHPDDVFKKYAIPCLLIPFYRIDDKIEIIQARFFDPKVKPKYITLKLNPDAPKIYNKDFVDVNKPIYILEGPIDSMSVNNSIALGGSDGSIDYPDRIWCWDNEPDNQQINAKLLKKIKAGEKVIIWRKTDAYKDINEAIVGGHVEKKDVEKLLKERTFSGLKAQLEFTKYTKNC